jgi:type VI secretion system protein ImpC
MHKPEFQKLEGTWRGLHYLVDKSETGEALKIRVLNCSKRELFKDLDKAVEFDQSQLYKKI